MCSRHSFQPGKIELLRSHLLSWYDYHKRQLPWRDMTAESDKTLMAYKVWVSEVMLQQTQVRTVLAYYKRWMEKWPTVGSLSGASLEEVNAMWSGLGYYNRARMLLEASKKVVTELGGSMPATAEALQALPGVGRYTANAIASISFNERVPVVDGNVIRVLTRLREIGAPVQSHATMSYIWQLADELVDPLRPGDFNQAIMELGAVCCTPVQPNCSGCPLGLNALCGAQLAVQRSVNVLNVEDCHLCISTDSFDKNLGVTNYPVKLRKNPARKETTVVVIAYVELDSEIRFLLFQRPRTGLLAGLWEFPSALKTELTASDHSPSETALVSLLLGRIASTMEIADGSTAKWRPTSIGQVNHLFSHIRMTYSVYSLKLAQADACPTLGLRRWVSMSELLGSPIATSTRKILSLFKSATAVDEVSQSSPKPKTPRTRNSSTRTIDNKQSRLDDFF